MMDKTNWAESLLVGSHLFKLVPHIDSLDFLAVDDL